MPYYRPQNEQAMVHTAAAFAKARRGLGTFACTSSIGPGATNMITGAADGHRQPRCPCCSCRATCSRTAGRTPCCSSSSIPIEHDVSVNDASGRSRATSTGSRGPSSCISALPEAFRVLTDPAETGAVTISLPEDVQAEVYDWPERFFERASSASAGRGPSPRRWTRVAALMRGRRRPLIVAGGGVYYSEAEAALRALATTSGIPVA